MRSDLKMGQMETQQQINQKWKSTLPSIQVRAHGKLQEEI